MPADRVRFLDLRRSFEAQRDLLEAATARVMDSGHVILGPEVEAFESEYSSWLGARHTVGVASGTDALELALRALDVGPGDEVVTQANTCVPTVAAIERAGATPVLCDVEPLAGTMDPQSLAAALSAKTRAIVPVHLYGQCAELPSILEVADGIPIVEDCAQAHGATLDGRMAGTIGTLGAYSFYPTKNLGALGDGGAVATDDDELAERLRMLRQYGQANRYEHVLGRGVNSRLDEMQAAILRVRLEGLTAANARRAEIADAYSASLTGPVRPLARLPGRRHVFHLFVCLADNRAGFRRGLSERGIQTLIHYPRPIHGHGPYRTLGNGPVPLVNAERLAERIVSLPMYPELTDIEVEAVVVALEACAGLSHERQAS